MNGTACDSAVSVFRLSNWDLLRSLCMFAVVVVHSGLYLGTLVGIDAGGIASATAIICDPIFFALSGYFGIRPLKGSLASYYSHKLSTIVLPLILYSVLLYLFTTGFAGATPYGYIAFFYDEMSPWWFIPALIPFLVIAPFLYQFFEKLNDCWIKMLVRLVCALTAWGFVSFTAAWVFRSSGHETIVFGLGILQHLVPTEIIPGSGYFMYFCMGYFFRRLAPNLSEAMRRRLIVLGLCAWTLDVVCGYFGIDRFDPSFLWLFTSISIMLIFDSIRIRTIFMQRVLEWTGRRSYAIYLVQYTAIGIVAPYVYDVLLNGCIGTLIAPMRLVIWLGVVVGSYLLSLFVASIIDMTFLKLVQIGFEEVVSRIIKRFEQRLA